ncbi:MAG TPA: hypothetical protein DDY20_01275 [Desulfobulbaceae bacterium]|nr:hypothetical protein [Desulfobulbaceae bacterium]
MLQELVTELKKHVAFKKTTAPGDLVLIAADNPRMLVYARVEAVEPDTGRKDSWWHVTMQMLTVPPQLLVWTLREPQFTGRELFTMGGDQRFMQALLLEREPIGADPGTDEAGLNGNIRPFRRVR